MMLCIASSLFAQSTTGTIFGDVTDATGAVIPNATITLTETRTGEKHNTVSDSKGEYTYAIVNPGDYTVTASLSGFKTTTQTGIALAADQNIRVPFMLATGEVTETVSVEAGVTLVDTREAQLGETIDQNKVENLPTLNRDAYSLLTITPGVTNYTADSNIGTRAGVSVSVNGLSADQASYYLDGSYDTVLASNGGNKIPNPDALSEVRVLTSNFDAEFGRSPSAVINAITRSGTDRFHGAAYDYIRNNILDARNYFVAPTSPTNPAVQNQQNQFGGRIGGPVMLLPQTFFFLDYQGTVQRTQDVINAGTVQTLTAAERTGDFSQDAAAPASAPVFGKTGAFQNPAAKLNALAANCGTATAPVICNGTNYNAAISGKNGSAKNFLDPVAQNVLKLVPVGAAVGSAQGVHTIGQQVASAPSISNEGVARFDFNHFHNHQIEAMLYYAKGSDTNPTAGTNQLLGYGGSTDTAQQFNVVAADVWTLSDRTVNSFRAFTSRNHYTIFNEFNQSAQSFGSTLVPAGNIYAPSEFNIKGYIDIGGGAHGPANVNQVAYGGIDTINLNRGTHSIKVGGSYVWNEFSNDLAKTAGGNFTFTGSVTGNTFADFLIGAANSLTQASVVTHNNYNYDPSLYAQDDWQITHRLNLNLGVRWEVFTPYFGDTSYGSFAAGVQSTVLPSAPIGILYQGDAGVPQGVFNTSYQDFAPRVGFAYDVNGNGKTSLRGGFGVFFFEQNNGNSSAQVEPPYTLTTTTSQTPNLVCPYGGTIPQCPVGTTAGTDPFPYDPTHPIFQNPAGGTTLFAIPRDGGAIPYVYEYNLTLEQQLTPRIAMHVAYVGNALRKNYITVDENSPVYTDTTTFAQKYGTISETGNPGLFDRRPYEPYGAASTRFKYGAIQLTEPSDNGTYSSLQTTLRGRITRHFNILASYVWSKSLNYDGPSVNAYNIKQNYGVSNIDLRHRFVISYLYELPTTNRLGVFGREVLDGWHINGITAFQSGSPFTVTSGVDTNMDGVNNDYVNIAGNPVLPGGRSRAQKIQSGTLNPAAFSVPANVSPGDNPYGNEQRNQFFGPANINTDLSLFKEFPIYEQVRLQFRAEAFNAFNNVNLNAPRAALANIQTVGLSQITGAAAARRLQFAAKILF